MNLTDNTPTNSDKIVRQNSLSHADEWIKHFETFNKAKDESEYYKFLEDEYFSFAEKCEEWVNRKK